MSIQRIAVMSDIHGNRQALEAVLKDIDGRAVDCIVNLGDSVYGPMDPGGVAEILMERNLLNIKGNQDRVIVEKPPDFNNNSSLEFTLARLAPHHLEWLNEQPVSTVTENGLYLCHGTPEKDTEYLLEKVTERGVSLKSEAELLAYFSSIPQKIILCGHSHLPRTVCLEGDRWVINPGSVGLQAYTDDLPYPHAMAAGNPLAKYCILELDSHNRLVAIQHIEIPYNWHDAALAAETNGKGDWAQWLKKGTHI